MDNAQAEKEIEAIKKRRQIAKRSHFRRSKLMAHRAELVALKKNGASYPDLVAWLKTKRVKVSHTTVMRYLKSLPEMNKKNALVS